jgi:hypothetical protein
MSARENSVRHLGNFYTVVAGLALTTAIYNLVDASGQLKPFTWDRALLCAAVLVTLLPFYHGAMRHLDITYVEEVEHQPKPGALMADFVILFLEGCFFIALAVKIIEPITFAFMFTVLLLVDAVWSFLANLAFSAPNKGKAELTWAGINFVTVLILVAFLYSKGLIDNPATSVNPVSFSVAILIIAIGRSVIDYWLSWKHKYYSW